MVIPAAEVEASGLVKVNDGTFKVPMNYEKFNAVSQQAP
jgi:hypothetical protein